MAVMCNPRRWLRVLAIVVVTAAALALRLRAVDRLPIDFDEDDYLLAGQRYAQALQEWNWGEIVNYDYNFEHPPLPKLMYGLILLPLPPSPSISELSTSAAPARSLPQPHFHAARLTAAAFGVLEVLALAVFDPLAALFLGIHTWQIKYTGQIMLEPLPALMSALTVLFYVKGRAEQPGRWNCWLALSAVTLGLTAASKYVYCIAGIAILMDWLWASFAVERPQAIRAVARWLTPVIVWGLISLVVFVAADPRLWVDPFARLSESVLYHASYAQSAHVKAAGFPVWQPFVWLSESVPWHPGVFVVSLDVWISLLAILGAPRLWRAPHQRVFVIWLVGALGFLTWWTTKWPQYILILTAPLMVAAAEGFRGLWAPVVAGLRRWRGGGLVEASATPEE